MKNVKVLGVPFDFGQDHSGVRHAYSYMMREGLLSRLRSIASTKDLGQLTFPEKIKETSTDIKWAGQASYISRMISEDISRIHLDNDFLLTIGGDHGMSLGTIHGLLKHRKDSVVIWADAHGDINSPETSPSGNFHGMPLAFLMNLTNHKSFDWISHHLKPNRLILFGPRDLDSGEERFIKDHGIQYYSSDEINFHGAKELIEIALHRADPDGTAPIHLSFDVDIFDHEDIAATGTRVHGGPRIEEVFLMAGVVAETGRLKSMDVVEFNPLIGTEDEVRRCYQLIEDFIAATLEQVMKELHDPRLPLSLLSKVINHESLMRNL